MASIALFVGLFYGLVARDRLPTALQILCDSNSNFHVYASTRYGKIDRPTNARTYWDPGTFLGITLGFGHFCIPATRVIDGLCDVVVARCDQAALAMLAYPVLRQSLDVEAEQSGTSLSLYATLAFEKVSFTSAWTTSKAMCWRGERAAVEKKEPYDKPSRMAISAGVSTRFPDYDSHRYWIPAAL